VSLKYIHSGERVQTVDGPGSVTRTVEVRKNGEVTGFTSRVKLDSGVVKNYPTNELTVIE